MRGKHIKSLLLTTALACAVNPANAAIPFGPTGSGILTFATTPVAADFSQTSVAGGGATPADQAGLDAAVQLLTSAGITAVLPTSATVPPSANAAGRHNTALQALQFRPTGNAYTVIMATLQNDSGSTVNNLVIAYDMAVQTPLAGHLPGLSVYYSLTGEAGSWNFISALSGVESGIMGSGSLDLSAGGGWAAGAQMFVIWADDNADAITDPSYTIDNVEFSSMVAPPTPPSIVVQPVSVTVNEGQVARLSVAAAGSSPISYQWYLAGAPIAGATGTTLVVTNMAGSGLTTSVSSDSGAYYVIVTGVGEPPTVTSDTVTVTVNADVTAPTFAYARCNPTNDTGFILVLSEAVNNADNDVGDQFNWTIADAADPGSTVAFATDPAYAAGDTNIYFTAEFPRNPGTAYIITYNGLNNLRDLSQAANEMPSGGSVVVTCFSNKVLIAANATWKYLDDDTDVAAAYRVPTFDDSAWKTGTGVFDAVRAGAGSLGANCRDLVGGFTVNTCLILSNATLTADIPAAYFRTHFTLTADDVAKTTMLRLETVLDDGAAYYINGRQLTKLYLPALPLDPLHTTLATGPGNAAVGTASLLVHDVYVGDLLQVGDNVMSAEVRQINLTSSDLTFGLQVISLSAEVPAVLPTLTIVHEGGSVRITWTGAGTLQYKDDISTVGGWTDQASGFVAPGEYLIPADQAHRFFSLRP